MHYMALAECHSKGKVSIVCLLCCNWHPDHHNVVSGSICTATQICQCQTFIPCNSRLLRNYLFLRAHTLRHSACKWPINWPRVVLCTQAGHDHAMCSHGIEKFDAKAYASPDIPEGSTIVCTSFNIFFRFSVELTND